jgi:predicted CopG family antitoxin
LAVAVKTISLTEEAYRRLVARRKPSESFSDAVLRLTGRSSLLELAGVLTRGEADELQRSVRERRAAAGKRLEKTAKEMGRA